MGSQVRQVARGLVVAVALLTARVAAADSIVIESYDGERPADAESLLAPVHAELARRGFATGDALVARIGAQVSASSGQLTASQGVEAQKLVDTGYSKFIDGEYPAAAAAVEKALAIYATAPGQMAKEDALRDLQFKALLVAARSYEVIGKGEDAFRAMAEAIRTFPDRHVSAAEFDPKVNALFRRVKAELTKQGTGSLEVKVDDAAAVIFVNERFVGTGTARLDALFPGAYRVYVAKGAQPGRVRQVQVSAGVQAVAAVTWQIDGTLRTGPRYVGVEFPAGTGADQEIALATRLGRELRAPTVIVLGLRQVDGRRAIVGFAVSTESQTRSFAAVQVEPVDPPRERLTTLAAFLSGDKKVAPEGLITREPRPARPRAIASEAPSRPFRVLKWVVTGAGVAAAGTGITLYLLDEPETQIDGRVRGEKSFNGKTPGLVVGAAGVALIAAGAYMFIADRGGDEEEGPVMSFTPTAGADGVGVAVSCRF